jgi:hypothetical protein
MQRLEIGDAVRPLCLSLGVKGLKAKPLRREARNLVRRVQP